MRPASDSDISDRALIERSIEGDRDALNALVVRHQPFVFNVAMKMFGSRADAEDLTQEIFIRVITSLRTFRAESAFSTWLYRIAMNHLLKTRRRGMELETGDFEEYFDKVAAAPDEIPDKNGVQISGSTVEELRVRCTTGMLMCLDREQRVVFILGAMFNVDHAVGGEVLGLTPGNFRVRLHRARKDLYQWMNRRCGLVNKANPCRCRNKTRAFVRLGLVDPQQLVFSADHRQRIEDLSHRHAREVMETVDTIHERVFLDHPVQLSRARVVDDILGNATLRTFFELA
jgi:RNA polymerase sigma factor (sigma-70 family)